MSQKPEFLFHGCCTYKVSFWSSNRNYETKLSMRENELDHFDNGGIVYRDFCGCILDYRVMFVRSAIS